MRIDGKGRVVLGRGIPDGRDNFLAPCIFTFVNMMFPSLSTPLPEGAVEGINFVGLRDFTGRPSSFNAQACQ